MTDVEKINELVQTCKDTDEMKINKLKNEINKLKNEINKLKKEIKELKAHCRAVDDVNAKMKNCTNCKYSWSEESAEFCIECDSEYSEWELKEE